jgi:hypothetical protein
MATDVIGTITNVINSPPGQLAAGAALGGIVWKFFERVEAVLTDQTKFVDYAFQHRGALRDRICHSASRHDDS